MDRPDGPLDGLPGGPGDQREDGVEYRMVSSWADDETAVAGGTLARYASEVGSYLTCTYFPNRPSTWIDCSG